MIRVTLGLALALFIAVVWGWSARTELQDTRAEKRLLADQIARARVAEGVARVELDLERDRRAELSAAIAEIYGGTDAPLPDHLRKLLSADGL
jgi:hypothetical protein